MLAIVLWAILNENANDLKAIPVDKNLKQNYPL
jgi:hypothetical protein